MSWVADLGANEKLPGEARPLGRPSQVNVDDVRLGLRLEMLIEELFVREQNDAEKESGSGRMSSSVYLLHSNSFTSQLCDVTRVLKLSASSSHEK